MTSLTGRAQGMRVHRLGGWGWPPEMKHCVCLGCLPNLGQDRKCLQAGLVTERHLVCLQRAERAASSGHASKHVCARSTGSLKEGD